jgi:hypothetical protein
VKRLTAAAEAAGYRVDALLTALSRPPSTRRRSDDGSSQT